MGTYCKIMIKGCCCDLQMLSLIVILRLYLVFNVIRPSCGETTAWCAQLWICGGLKVICYKESHVHCHFCIKLFETRSINIKKLAKGSFNNIAETVS